MKAVFTSASANKRIRSLKEQLGSLLSAERENSTTSYCEGETPIQKEYSFLSTQADIRQINDQIAKLRHAINCFNTTTQVPGFSYTVDEALVRMRMLTEYKSRMQSMKDMPPLARHTNYKGVSEYTVCNYESSEAQQEYKAASDELSNLQLALDTVNLTETFEVDL